MNFSIDRSGLQFQRCENRRSRISACLAMFHSEARIASFVAAFVMFVSVGLSEIHKLYQMFLNASLL